jgi:zinc metalloprotease ZmpA
MHLSASRTLGAGAATLLVAALATGTTVAAHAAGGDGHSSTRQVATDGGLAHAALTAVRAHTKAVHGGGQQSFAVTGALVDRDGTSHVRMTRTYRGLPVLGGDLVVHQGPGGAWKGRSETLSHDLTLAVTPTVGAATARTAALAPRRANRAISGQQVASSRLVVDATGTAPRLAYEVVTAGTQRDGTPSRLASYVDARTGAVIRSEQQIETVDGSGQSLYGGTVPLQLTLSGSTYQLKDPTRGNTYTTDVGNATDPMRCQLFGSGCPTGTLFTSPDNSFGSTGPTRRGTTTRTCTAGTGSSAPGPGRSTGCITARSTTTPSGTAPR